jgi:hypothetical protein
MVVQIAVGASGIGQDAIGLALVALASLAVLCGTVILLVLATARADRAAVIRQLTPVLLQLAEKITSPRKDRRR